MLHERITDWHQSEQKRQIMMKQRIGACVQYIDDDLQAQRDQEEAYQ